MYKLDSHNSSMKNRDAARKFKAIQAWWQDMAQRNSIRKPDFSNLQRSRTIESGTDTKREYAAKVIQSRFRGFITRSKFHTMINAVTFLQTVFRAWMRARQELVCVAYTTSQACDFSCDVLRHSQTYRRYAMLFVHRHSLVKLKRSAKLIQQAVRSWLYCRHQQGCSRCPSVRTLDPVTAAITIQKFVRGWMARYRYIFELDLKEKAMNLAQQNITLDLHTNAAVTIQLAWKNYRCCKSTCQKQHLLATKIQSNFRRWFLRKRFLNHVKATIKVQSYFRMWRCVKALQHLKVTSRAATFIQAFLRGWIARKEACARKNHIVDIQRHCRCWLMKRDFLLKRDAAVKIQCIIRSRACQKVLNCQKDAALEIQRFIRGDSARNRLLGGASTLRALIPISCISRPVGVCSFQLELLLSSVVKLQRWWKRLLFHKLANKSAMIIQSCARGWMARRKANIYRHQIVVVQEDAAVEIQRFVRGHITRNRLLGCASSLRAAIPVDSISSPVGCCSIQLKLFLFSVVKLQRWWKRFLTQKNMTNSAITIQSCIRGWIARQKAVLHRHQIVVIQSHWKGYLARRESKQLLDLRLRMRESARNVDDSKRLINRLLAALSELLNMKSLSDVLHTCSTLDMATEHSQKCCEELVAAGAIDTLLGLIRSVSRSIPDQEVLKHALSTLRNLGRYPHLLEVLIQTHNSIQIIVMELLRNKEEGYFIASELMKKICSTHSGVQAVLKSPALLKRLHNLVDELKRKAVYEKRNGRSASAVMKDNRERRLKEAAEILKLIARA